MSLAEDTALVVMKWEQRTNARQHPRYGWNRRGRPTISRETWRPAHDLNQALEVLSEATRGAEYHIVCRGGFRPTYTIESAGIVLGPSLSLPAIMCQLALRVVRGAS